jgi:SEC-C motif
LPSQNLFVTHQLEFRLMNNLEFNELKIRFAINGAEGDLALAAGALGLSRAELVDIATRAPDILDFILEIREQNADNCQEFLDEAVEAGAPWAIKYTLRTIGANRGYGNQGAANKEPEAGNKEPGIVDQQLPNPAASNWRLSPTDPLVPALNALEEAKGHVTRAATALGKTRTALQKLIAESPALQMEIFQQREALVDHAESALRKAIHAKRPWAIVFTLSTIRRNAGFGRQSKRSNSSKSRLLNPQPSSVPEIGAQRANTANFDSRVPNSMPVQGQPTKNQEPGIEIERNHVSAPNQPRPILIGAAAGANNAAPASGDLAGVAAKRSVGSPIVNGAPTCARNAPCPCASGRKFKRCCGA